VQRTKAQTLWKEDRARQTKSTAPVAGGPRRSSLAGKNEGVGLGHDRETSKLWEITSEVRHKENEMLRSRNRELKGKNCREGRACVSRPKLQRRETSLIGRGMTPKIRRQRKSIKSRSRSLQVRPGEGRGEGDRTHTRKGLKSIDIAITRIQTVMILRFVGPFPKGAARASRLRKSTMKKTRSIR